MALDEPLDVVITNLYGIFKFNKLPKNIRYCILLSWIGTFPEK